MIIHRIKDIQFIKSTNEKLTQEEIKKINEYQEKLAHLIQGGYVGVKNRQLSFGKEKAD